MTKCEEEGMRQLTLGSPAGTYKSWEGGAPPPGTADDSTGKNPPSGVGAAAVESVAGGPPSGIVLAP